MFAGSTGHNPGLRVRTILTHENWNLRVPARALGRAQRVPSFAR